MKMNEDEFWKIISLFDWDQAGDDEAVLEPAMNALIELEVEDIYGFDDILAEKLHALDTREHCRACYEGEADPDNGDDYISADDFLYCRCVVVANGREYYQAILSNPKDFPQELEFESLLSLPITAYEEKTDDEYEHISPISYESFQNKEGWKASGATQEGKFTDEKVPPGNRRPS